MKKFATTLVGLCLSALMIHAQQAPLSGETAPAASSNCFEEYYKLFRERGSKPVSDGMQNVVVAYTKDNATVCVMGKIIVDKGKIVPPLWIVRADGSSDKVDRTLDPAYKEQMGGQINNILDGMSPTYITTENEKLRLYFIDFLNPATSAAKMAPDPTKVK